MIIVYLSNRYIRVVDGEASGNKIHAKHLMYTVDHQGSVLNGTITDEGLFLELIEELWESNHLPKKSVKLLIDSNQFTTKVIEAPLLKPKQTLEYVGREFNDVERITNPVYGFFNLGGEKKAKIQRLFAMMAPREFIQKYIDLFAKAGIALENVESALGATLRLIEYCPMGKDTTCIFQFVDDMTLISLLVVDGQYQYSSRNRLFSDAGTPEYAVETARNVSNILQFAKAQELAQQIPLVYSAGFDEGTYQIYQDSLYQIDDQMQVEHLELDSFVRCEREISGNQELTNFAIVLGGLLKVDAKTSIRAQMGISPEKLAAKKKRRKTVVPLAALAGVLLVVLLISGGRMLYYQMQLKALEEYNKSEDIITKCDTYDEMRQQVQVMGTLSGSMESLKTTLLAYPKVDRTTERTIESCATGLVAAEIQSYDSSSGIISFKTSSADVNQIHKFIKLLSEQAIFAAVDYTGYSQDSEGTWNVNVNCTMAGRQEEQQDDTEAN